MFLSVAVVLLFFVASQGLEVSSVPFKAGEGGYACYRIPALVEYEGGIAAFAEGRKFSCADHGWNDIVMRTSTDGGQSWSALRVVYGESTSAHHVTIGNPAPFVDRTGTVWMPCCRDNHDVLILRADVTLSSWSLVHQTNYSHGEWVATGPPGSVSVDGIFVVPINHYGYSGAIVSSDRGFSWNDYTRRGAAAQVQDGNENQVAAVAPHTLLMYARGIHGGKLLAHSTNLGETWSRPAKWIDAPACEGSLVLSETSSGEPVLLASVVNPRNATGARERLVVYKAAPSTGPAFEPFTVVETGPAAYSALLSVTKAARGSTAVLYEGGETSPYEELRFKMLPVLE